MENSKPMAKFAHLGINQTFKEMPTEKSALDFNREFSAREYEAIRAGLLSRDMDGKWDFFLTKVGFTSIEVGRVFVLIKFVSSQMEATFA